MKVLAIRQKSLIFWWIFYEGNLVVDVLITGYILTFFPQLSEGNPLVRTLITVLGLSGGLLAFCLMESVMMAVLISCVKLTASWLHALHEAREGRKDWRVELTHLIVVQLLLPYLLITSGVVHLFGTLAWVLVVIFSSAESSGLVSFLIYVTMGCCLLQAILVIQNERRSHFGKFMSS